jgi:hypothetical protein
LRQRITSFEGGNMNSRSLLRPGSLLVVLAIAACADAPTVAPVRAPTGAALAASGAGAEDRVTVSPRIAEINAELAAVNAKVRLAKIELLRGPTWNGVSSTLIVANDRARGIGMEWVKGDPNRDGRTGVSYQIVSNGVMPNIINANRTTIRAATPGELELQIEEAMSAWRSQTCSDNPITRAAVPAGTDPNFLDNLFLGLPLGANYAQTADIVQGGWMPAQFFRNIATFFGEPPASGDAILGITFTFTYVDENNNPTDLDRNRKDDLALAEIYYNSRHVWDNSGLVDLRVVDFFSVIAHETGHALGLNHLGKIFITGPDVADGSISLSEVKYAPYALMNASYIAGRNDIEGLDRSQFCQIWAGR